MTQLFSGLFPAAARIVRGRIADWRRNRRVRDTHMALHELDSRTLHDLGIHRTEIASFVRETHGEMRRTRVRAGIAPHGSYL